MLRSTRSDDRGVALIAVMGLGMVMLVLIATALTAATSGLRQADTTQDASGAYDAAYAGAQDYLARINLNSNYLRFGNPSAPFSTGSAVTIPTANPNDAFGLGTSGTWATVPGSAGTASFRYEPDTRTYAATGVVRLRSTGRVGQVTRSIVSSFRVRGFVDYTYFTDKEIQDPQITGANATACDTYLWQGRSSACGTIQFSPRDVLNGRVHSNDTMTICGATFNGDVTTANPASPVYNLPANCSAPNRIPTRAALLPLPSTNTAMQGDAKCVYTGPTQITYNADGTMTVISPWTKFADLNSGTATNSAACGSPAALASVSGAIVPQLSGNSLFVKPVTTDSSDPNSWATNQRPAAVTCVAADGSTTNANDGPGWSISNGSTTLRYPLSGESPATGWRVASGNTYVLSTLLPPYGCRAGDLYVSGRVTVPTTAASGNYVYVTGDITYDNRSEDVLGLVGQNAVLVWNPVSTSETLMRGGAREIDAALLSVAHTFQVQNYDRVYQSTVPTLTVFGAIAQKFRGPVGTTGNTGYIKSYSYNPLLGTISPPNFLAPSAISFLLQRYAGVPAAFTPTGAAQ